MMVSELVLERQPAGYNVIAKGVHIGLVQRCSGTKWCYVSKNGNGYGYRTRKEAAGECWKRMHPGRLDVSAIFG